MAVFDQPSARMLMAHVWESVKVRTAKHNGSAGLATHVCVITTHELCCLLLAPRFTE
jgi:hypothetical protein